MIRIHRPRRPSLLWVALTAVLALGLAACGGSHPNTTFDPQSEFARDIDALWDLLLAIGTVVFIGVEVALIYVLVRFRKREGAPHPKHIHGNTTLELTWTLIPAIILIFIAVPTVRTIFRTQAKASPNALVVEVIGHQWWWEFRYPQLGIVTANELYLPAGRTVNFTLKTADVIHSFWVPQLGGKRDLISNHTNYLWFTPDSSTADNAWNGFCAEYCGASHANMQFRTFTVSPAEFDRWVAQQRQPAAFGAVAAPAGGGQPAAGAPAGARPAATGGDGPPPGAPVVSGRPTSAPVAASSPDAPRDARQAAQAPPTAGTGGDAGPTLALRDTYVFPRDSIGAHVMPNTPVPDGLTFPENLTGDPEQGRQIYSRSACIGCHVIEGNPASRGIIGPSLTHLAGRFTIGAGMYPNDARHLALWIKNTRAMKPGSLMPTLGKGQTDPVTGRRVPDFGALDDQQIAHIVAYLQALR
jgi:cytochrome c oxidase subunit 2